MNKINDRLTHLEKDSVVDRLGIFQHKTNRYSLGLIDVANGYTFTRVVDAKIYSQATICVSTNLQVNVTVKLNNLTIYYGDCNNINLSVMLNATNIVEINFSGSEYVYAVVTISGNIKADKFYPKVKYLGGSLPLLVAQNKVGFGVVKDVDLRDLNKFNINQNFIINNNIVSFANIVISKNNVINLYQLQCEVNDENISINVLNNTEIVINNIDYDTKPIHVAFVNFSSNDYDFALLTYSAKSINVYFYVDWRVAKQQQIELSKGVDFVGIDSVINLDVNLSEVAFNLFVAYSQNSTYLVRLDDMNLEVSITQVSSNLLDCIYIMGNKLYVLCDTKFGTQFKVLNLSLSGTKITLNLEYTNEYINHDALFVVNGKLYSLCSNLIGVVYEG